MSSKSWSSFNRVLPKVAEGKEYRWYEARIWIALLLISMLCLGITIINHVPEIKLWHTGNVVYGRVMNETSIRVENTGDLIVLIRADKYFYTVPRDGRIPLYYYGDNYKKAIALTAPWFWGINYSVWGIIFSLSGYSCYKHLYLNKNAYVQINDNKN